MIKDLSARVQRIKPSPTLAVSARADQLIAEGKNIINLSVGEPDFDTPQHIKDAAIQAIQDGFTKYTAVDGTPGLKRAIINKFARDNQLSYAPDQIIVSCGAKHSLFNIFEALLNLGDEVIVPAPFWVSYPDIAKIADAVPVIVKADIEQNFKITPAQLEAAITSATRIFVINSPSNPSGMAYSKDELKALGAVLLRYPNIIVVTDDIYEHTLFQPEKFVNILMACPALYDRCLVVNGASKVYAMTGWRIGYTAGPSKIISAMKKIQSQSTSNPSSISQVAAEVALNGSQHCIKVMVDAYKERHDYIVAALEQIPGVLVRPCHGTFYTFPNVEGLIKNSTQINNDVELAEYLLTEAEIAVIPGSAFGMPGYLRISYATSMIKIQDAMRRFTSAVAKL